MPVELRKRKAPEPAPAPPAKKGTISKAVSKVKQAVKGSPKSNGESKKVTVGDTVSLDNFGGEIETNDGVKTSLKKLVDESKGGVVLFTYPKASTPGCTTQVCLFRDSYEPLTATGYSIYGLSTDSPKANTTFKTKQNLPYPLLCDPSATLIGAIGLKKAPKGTTRGVFVIDKSGKVLAAEPGGPAATVDVVKRLVSSDESKVEKVEQAAEEAKKAEAKTEGQPAVEGEKPLETAVPAANGTDGAAEAKAEEKPALTVV